MSKTIHRIDMSPEVFQEKFMQPDGSVKDKFLDILHHDFQIKAKELLRPVQRSYIINKKNEEFYWTVMTYFARNKRFFDSPLLWNKDDASFDKGLMICGINGAGKTFMFRVLDKLSPLVRLVGNEFSTVWAQDVVTDFNQNGYKEIVNNYRGQRYFDDIGAESIGSNFGKEEIFRIILEARHRIFEETGTKTFFTTNLTEEEIEERYGKRVDSRIYQMFNLIFAKSIDFRKHKL